MKFETPYTHDRGRSATFAVENNEPTMTQVSDRNETDINVIMARFGVTGQLPTVLNQPQFGDFSEVTDYRTALDLIRSAQDEFMKQPAKIRARFGNDPAAFHDFVTDPANAEEMIKLGLAKKPPKPETSPAPSPAPSQYDDEGESPRQPSQQRGSTQNGNTSTRSDDGRSAVPPAQGARGSPRVRE